MKIIQAPNAVDKKEFLGKTVVFLSGGISGCKDWQGDLIRLLGSGIFGLMYDFDDVVLVNPRREEFDMSDPLESIIQIKWEHRMLERCDILAVFFPASESVQPITLYELGKYSNIKPTIVTMESEYKRAIDVRVQTALDGIYSSIHKDYDEAIVSHATRIADMIQNYGPHRRRRW